MTDTESDKHAWLILPAVISILLDRIVTAPMIHLEYNPIVVDMGLGPWLFMTGILLLALTYVWFHFQAYQHPAGRVLIVFIALVHAAMAVANLSFYLFVA